MHYRVSLAKPLRDPHGGRRKVVMVVAEVHKDRPKMEKGWQKVLRSDPRANVRMSRCFYSDDECEKYSKDDGGASQVYKTSPYVASVNVTQSKTTNDIDEEEFVE